MVQTSSREAEGAVVQVQVRAHRYAWHNSPWGASGSVSPQTVGERLEFLAAVNNGELRTLAVVEDARPEAAPLHNLFEWDDDVAATEFRKVQARSVISAVRVVYDSGVDAPEQHQLAYVNVQNQDGDRVYVPATVVAANQDYYEYAVSDAMKALGAWERRYAQIAEMRPVIKAIEMVRQGLDPGRG